MEAIHQRPCTDDFMTFLGKCTHFSVNPYIYEESQKNTPFVMKVTCRMYMNTQDFLLCNDQTSTGHYLAILVV